MIFSLWLHSGKNYSATILALENMALGQVESMQKGGRTMISTTIGGESFSYQLAGNLSPAEVTRIAYDGWRAVQRVGADGVAAWLAAEDVANIRFGMGGHVEI